MQSVTLHQALHGYKDGHRAIASSIELGAQDAKTLLFLSDVSGPGSRLETSGYITGYPLPNAGLYALARTWPAPEMSRPGCVWTQTLLIDFADLATVGNPVQLLTRFQRPEGQTFAAYTKAISFDEDTKLHPLSDEVALISKTLMAALYQFPSKPVISFQANSRSSEEAVLAIWGQQWPRLRRSFRFCTSASSDRSTSDSMFDLQLLPPAMPSVKSRFLNAVEARVPEPEPDWLQVATDELIKSQPDGLRQFLFQAGSDLQNGRSSFVNLCRIFGLLENTDIEQVDVESAIKLIPAPTDALNARALKGMVTRRLFARPDVLSKKVLSYVVEHLDLLDVGSSNEEFVRFGQKLIRAQPQLFLRMSESGDLGEQVCRKALAAASINDILKAVKRAPPILPTALKARPNLLCESDIWSGIDANDTEILNGISELENLRDALRAAIIAERMDLSEALLRQTSPMEILLALHDAYLSDRLETNSLRAWIEAVGSSEVIAKFFSSQRDIACHFLLAVSCLYSPDEIPVRAKKDPWLTALEVRQGELDGEDEIHFRAYLLARALGQASTNAAELALFGFEKTDHAAATSRLSYHSWDQLESRLPWPMFWQDWDKCYRLRKGVAEKCIEDRWPAHIFASLTTDDEVFATLVWFTERSYRGRQYLKEISSALKDAKGAVVKQRRAIIKHILKGY